MTIEPLDWSAVLIAVAPAAISDLEAALGAMGLDLPRVGRFTEAGGLMLVRAAPYQIVALRAGSPTDLMDELAPLSAIAGLIDQSDARVAVRVGATSTGVDERLRRLLPLDLDRFTPGQCAQMLLAQLNVLVLRRAAGDVEVLCGRSFVPSLHRALSGALQASH